MPSKKKSKKSSKKTKKTKKSPPVTKGDSIKLMEKKAKPQTSVGVKTVRRQHVGEDAGKPRMRAYRAAEASQLFGRPRKGGGRAFARWVKLTKGLSPNLKQTAKEWEPLLEEFAARPIHGHRRGSTGGNHRINSQHRR